MKKIIVLIFVFLIAFTVPVFAADGGSSFGFWSLIPPLLAIVLAFLTKQVILSLFLGIFSGVLMLYGGNPFIAFIRTLDTYILGSLAESWNAGIIIFTLSIGGMVGLIGKTGGTKAIAEALSKKAKTARNSQIVTAIMGCLVFFDDYANTLIVGPTMRPLTDKKSISREKLAYIVDSTAAPVAGLALISTWIGYEIGIIADVFTEIGVQANAYMLFVRTLPYRFYSIFALILVFIIVIQGRDFGAMYKAEKRARLTGKVVADGSNPMSSDETITYNENSGIELKMSNAVVPIVTLVLVTFFGLWYNGYTYCDPGTPWTDIQTCFGNADPSVVLIWGAITASIVAGILAIARKIMTLGEVFDTWVEGCKSLLITAIILIMAWSIGSVVSDVGTADFLIQVVSGAIPGLLLPILVFGISCLVAFSTGTSWGTMAIVVPLAVPLAASYVAGDPTQAPVVLATLSAVLSGSIFGDHCSPISDTTVLSSMASGSDHIDHVKTQIPYAITGACFAMLAYIVIGITNSILGTVIAYLVCIAGMMIFVKTVGKKTDLESIKAE